jgi:hypothetical protein
VPNQQFIDSLYEVHALAVQVRQGAGNGKDLRAAQRKLFRKWRDAMKIRTAATIEGFGRSPNDGADRVLSQMAAQAVAEEEVLRQKLSVESIDTYIRLILSYQ